MASFNLFWFMLDISNYQLITSKYCIPSDIKDSKEIVLAETPIPGLNFKPITYGGGGNRKISFTLPLINRDKNQGNVPMLKMYESLRNQATGVTKLFSGIFTPTPQVLFQYGTGSLPLVYWVKKCDFNNKAGWINRTGQPQYTEIEIELWLDETSPLYFAEEVYRRAAALSGEAFQALSYIQRGKPI